MKCRQYNWLKFSISLTFICLTILTCYSQKAATSKEHKKQVDIICYREYSRMALDSATAKIFEGDILLHTLSTDSTGITRVKLFPGKYNMIVRRPGYKEKILNGFTILEDKINFIRISLKPVTLVKGDTSFSVPEVPAAK